MLSWPRDVPHQRKSERGVWIFQRRDGIDGEDSVQGAGVLKIAWIKLKGDSLLEELTKRLSN